MCRRHEHREIFFSHNGPGPYVCWHCETEVSFNLVHVHHVDHDHDNNDPANLVPVHHRCHSSLHKKNVPLSAEHRQRISDGLRGGTRMIDAKQRLKLSGALKGVPKSEIARARMSAAQKVHTHKCECGKTGRSGPLARHTTATGHKLEALSER